MARALSSRKILFSTLSDEIVLRSRGFSSSAAAVASARRMVEEKAVLMKGMKKTGVATSDAAAAPLPWIPDPVTGYYRPANFVREMDSAELRQIFLNKKAKI